MDELLQKADNLRVLYVAPDVVVPFPRGASTHVMEVAKGLADAGDEVHVLSRRLDRSQARCERVGRVTIHRIDRGILGPVPGSKYSKLDEGTTEASGLIGALYRFYLSWLFMGYAASVSLHIVRKYGIQVVLERETAFGAGALAGLGGGIPFVLEVVGPRYSRVSATRAKKILAYTKTMLVDIPDERVVIVDSGVDTSMFSPDPGAGHRVRMRLGIGEEEALVGYVGTFQAWHGLDSVLKALKALTPMMPLRLLLVGPYYGGVKAEARKLGLLSRCIFTGPVPYEDVPHLVNACQVMVAPYDPGASKVRSERGIGSPLKVFEYMACGKPVITTDIEPTNRLPGVGRAAVLVPPGDPGAISKAIELVLADPAKAARMGIAGRALVENGYSWKSFANRLHGILEVAAG